jgi:hypothetical protein
MQFFEIGITFGNGLMENAAWEVGSKTATGHKKAEKAFIFILNYMDLLPLVTFYTTYL